MQGLKTITKSHESSNQYLIDPTVLKKDIQQVLKICKFVNFFLLNHENIVLSYETGSLIVLIDCLRLMRKVIGNEVVLNVVQR